MSQRVKGKNATTVATGWDAVIADAQKRIRKLEISIKVFNQRREAGETCPFTQSLTTTSKVENAATHN
jgi:hypothetical protein